MRSANQKISETTVVCGRQDLVANSGVCAMLNGEQIALFYLPDENPQIYALSNWDPFGQANVLSRGVVGDLQGRLVVASPLYKQHFCLQSGACLEDESASVAAYKAGFAGDSVYLEL